MGAFQLILLTLLDPNLRPCGNFLHNSYSSQYLHVRRSLQVTHRWRRRGIRRPHSAFIPTLVIGNIPDRILALMSLTPMHIYLIRFTNSTQSK
jgi:hypothetical protein